MKTVAFRVLSSSSLQMRNANEDLFTFSFLYCLYVIHMMCSLSIPIRWFAVFLIYSLSLLQYDEDIPTRIIFRRVHAMPIRSLAFDVQYGLSKIKIFHAEKRLRPSYPQRRWFRGMYPLAQTPTVTEQFWNNEHSVAVLWNFIRFQFI